MLTYRCNETADGLHRPSKRRKPVYTYCLKQMMSARQTEYCPLLGQCHGFSYTDTDLKSEFNDYVLVLQINRVLKVLENPYSDPEPLYEPEACVEKKHKGLEPNVSYDRKPPAWAQTICIT